MSEAAVTRPAASVAQLQVAKNSNNRGARHVLTATPRRMEAPARVVAQATRAGGMAALLAPELTPYANPCGPHILPPVLGIIRMPEHAKQRAKECHESLRSSPR